MPATQRRELVSQVIASKGGGTLDDAVRALIREGMGWRRIADALKDRYEVNVPWQTLARWYRP